jgi:hypothetical protein
MRADAKNYESQDKKEKTAIKVSVFIAGFRRKILGHDIGSFNTKLLVGIDHSAAGSFDGCFGAFCHGQAANSYLAGDFAAEDNTGSTRVGFNKVSVDKIYQAYFIKTQLFKVAQTNFSDSVMRPARKASLRQTAMHRHLTAFETDFMETASTRLLTFVTATGCFTPTATNTAAHAMGSRLGTGCRLNGIEFHYKSLSYSA